MTKGPIRTAGISKRVNVLTEPTDTQINKGSNFSAVPAYTYVSPGSSRARVMLINVSQLRAGGPVIPTLLCLARVEYGRNTRRVVTATRFTTVMNTISIYGRARISLTERWQVLFSRYS